MPVSAINRIKFIAKKQKCIKGLKFGDRQNLIDRSVSTGVMDDSHAEDLDNENLDLTNANYDADIEDPNDHDVNESNPNNIETTSNNVPLETHEEKDALIEEENEDDDGAEANNYDGPAPEPINEANVENRDDEFGEEEKFIRTRSGRINRPCDCRKHLPETAHFQDDSSDFAGRCIRTCCYDEIYMVDKLSSRMHYSEICFQKE